jgi:succinate dehydrogenase/fumarate reductase iron-sulfur protein
MATQQPSTMEMRLDTADGSRTVVARTYAGHPGLSDGQPINVRIRTREPGDANGKLASFLVRYRKDMRIIDLLHAISDRGQSVAYRWFCSTKKCGGCGMRVNGEPRLVCWEAVDSADLLIEPLDKFDVVRDLVIDRTGYQARLNSLKPYMERKEVPVFPEPLTHKEIVGSYALMDCIECGICTSTCPAYTGVDGPFPGPWALVQAAKFARDPRDRMDRSAVIESSGAEHCMSCYRCEQVCPVSIPIVTEAIDPLRGMAARGPTGKASFPIAFARNIRKNVDIHSASLFLDSRSMIAALRSLPMALRMLFLGKTRLFAKGSDKARSGIAALFREAGEKEIG